jgi:hypothetical protein
MQVKSLLKKERPPLMIGNLDELLLPYHEIRANDEVKFVGKKIKSNRRLSNKNIKD